MNTLDTYIGITPFTVKIDDSPQLQKLAEQARDLRDLPFPDRLTAVKKLALDAMVNALEQMKVYGKQKDDLKAVTTQNASSQVDNSQYRHAKSEEERFLDIIVGGHPLGYALEQKAGACIHQSALFFVLAYEADLGDQHFIQAVPLSPGTNTAFNELVYGDQTYFVSIFIESLQGDSLNYLIRNPDIFAEKLESVPGFNMYSYHRRPSGLVIAENPTRHIKDLKR